MNSLFVFVIIVVWIIYFFIVVYIFKAFKQAFSYSSKVPKLSTPEISIALILTLIGAFISIYQLYLKL